MERLLNRFVGNISPSALLVSSFFWTWLDVVVFGPAVYEAAGVEMPTMPMVLSFASSIAVLAAAAASERLRSLLTRPRGFAGAAFLCGTIGTLLLFAGAHGQRPELLLAAGIVVGLFEGAGIVTVGAVATCQGTTNALIHIAAALPMNIVVILLVVFLVPSASLVLTALLPLLSALSFAVYLARTFNRTALATVLVPSRVSRPSGSAIHRRFGANGNFLCIVLAVTVAFGVVNAQTIEVTGNGPFDAYSGLVVRALVSAVVFVGYVRYSWRPQAIFNVALIVMAVSLVASAVVVAGAVQLVFLAGYVCFDLLIWALIVGMNHGSGISVLRTVCVVQAVDQAGILLGTFIPWAGDGQAVAIANAALGVAVMLLVMRLLVRDRSVVENMGGNDYGLGAGEPDPAAAAAREDGCGAALAPTESGEIPNLALQGSLDEIAGRYFLSSREVDILALLVAGRSGPYIADPFCISANTVKTHIRHIYTKLDVHDRQELLDLVQATLITNG